MSDSTSQGQGASKDPATAKRAAEALTGVPLTTADTIADLKTLIGEPSGTIVLVLGYYKGGDGGGGIFYWVATSTEADDLGLTIMPSTNPVSGRWKRIGDELNVKWFGAITNPEPAEIAAAKLANDTAFAKAITATTYFGGRIGPTGQGYPQAVFVPPGDYYLGNDLNLNCQVKLYGTARQGRSRLLFSAGKGVRILVSDGQQSEISQLYLMGSDCWTSGSQVTSLDTASIGNPGIFSNWVCILSELFISGFSGSGIVLTAPDGQNVNCSQIKECFVYGCGGHGIDIGEGKDAQGCLVIGSRFLYNDGNGIWEHGPGCNTYVSCVAEGNLRYGVVAGRIHGIPNNSNTSVFTGCHAEHGLGANTGTVFLGGSACWFGGVLSAMLPTVDPFAMMIRSGASHSPVIFSASVGMNPEPTPRVHFVAGGDRNNSNAACGWFSDDENLLYWLKRKSALKTWEIEWAQARTAMYLTARVGLQDHARGAGVFGARAILVGAATDNVRIERSGSPGPSLPDPSLAAEVGDILLNRTPVPGGSLGWVCVETGMQDQLRHATTTGDLPALSTALTLDNPTSFAINQYITIAGVTGIRQIVALAGTAATLNTAGDNVAPIVDGAVAVKMIGTIPNGSADLVVDDTSRLLVGQYIAIAGVTGRQKIVALGTQAALECAKAEPYDFEDGFTLFVQIDNGPDQTVTFHTTDFVDIHAATAREVAFRLDTVLTSSSTAATSGDAKVTITSDTKGVGSHVRVKGGTANDALGFSPSVVDGTANPVTLENINVNQTATDAIIEFWPATFGQFGRVEHLGTTIDPPDNYLASAGETIVVRTDARTVKLPLSPNDGDEVSVSNMCGTATTTTVDPNGATIYTMSGNDTLSDDVTRTYRYVAGGVDLWKRV